MPIDIPGITPSRKTPGFQFNVVLGGPGTGGGGASERLLIMGQKLEAAVTATVGTQTYTVAAGNSAADTPELCTGGADAIAKYGQGSELHQMIAAAFARNSDVEVWAVAVGKAGGSTQATTTLALTGSAPTSDLTVRLRIDGRIIETVISSGTSLVNAAIQIAQEINNNPDLPVFATVASTTVTFTSKCYGERFTRITVRVDVINGNAVSKLRTGALVATVATTVFTLGAATLSTAGSGTETTTLSSALAAVLPERYHRIAIPYDTATPIGTVMTQVTTKSGPTMMLWEQVIAACIADLSTATVGAMALTAGQNNPLLQVLWHYDSERLPGVIAAQAASARLLGDGVRYGEATRPQQNLDGLVLNRVPVQESAANYPTPTEIETALNYGVTPLIPSSELPGYACIARSITSQHRDSTGGLFYGVLDTTEVTVPHWVATDLRARMAVDFKSKNIDNDSTTPPKGPDVVTPLSVRSYVLAQLFEYEADGKIVEVEAHADSLKVERATSPRSRLNMDVPVVVPAGLHQLGANIRQLGGFSG